MNNGAHYRALAAQIAQQNGVPVPLFVGLVQQESNFNPSVISSAGAIGLSQLLPGTARALGVNPFDPVQNLQGGARYLRQQLDRFGSVPLALAAYNAGPGAVERYGGVPPFTETRNYVARVQQLAGQSATPSPILATGAPPSLDPAAPALFSLPFQPASPLLGAHQRQQRDADAEQIAILPEGAELYIPYLLSQGQGPGRPPGVPGILGIPRIPQREGVGSIPNIPNIPGRGPGGVDPEGETIPEPPGGLTALPLSDDPAQAFRDEFEALDQLRQQNQLTIGEIRALREQGLDVLLARDAELTAQHSNPERELYARGIDQLLSQARDPTAFLEAVLNDPDHSAEDRAFFERYFSGQHVSPAADESQAVTDDEFHLATDDEADKLPRWQRYLKGLFGR